MTFTLSPDPNVSTARTQWTFSTGCTRDHGGLSRTVLFHQIDASLTHLGTSYVDVLQVHQFDATTPVEETKRALYDRARTVRRLRAARCATSARRTSLKAPGDGLRGGGAQRLDAGRQRAGRVSTAMLYRHPVGRTYGTYSSSAGPRD